MIQRRSLLIAIGAMGTLSGCLGDSGGGFIGDDDTDTDDDGEANVGDEDREDGAQTLRSELEARDLTVNDVELDTDRIVVELQTSGDIDEDIRVTAGAFATVAGDVGEDIHVRVEDRGLTQESFTIENEWALEFADQQLSDEEFMDLIDETRS